MDYKVLKDKVSQKLKENGTPVFLKRKNKEVYDAETDTYISDYTIIEGYGLISVFDFDKIDGTVIKKEDVLVMASLPCTPTTEDILEISGKMYAIITVRVISPDAKTEIYYELQCR